MKEFLEQVRLYKEFLAIIAALVGGAFFVANYFATKEALTQSQDALNALVSERECQLGNRITVAEASASIAMLEREQIEKMREKIDLNGKTGTRVPPAESAYARERLEKVLADLSRIEGDVRSFRARSKEANDYLVKNACAGAGKKGARS